MFALNLNVKFNLTYIRGYHSGQEWTWELWQLGNTPYSSKFQYYWSLTIRLFNVIRRTLFRRSYPSAEMYLVHSEVKWTRLTGNSKKKKKSWRGFKTSIAFFILEISCFLKWLCLRLYQLSYTLEESYSSAEMYLVHSEVKWTRLTGNSKKKKKKKKSWRGFKTSIAFFILEISCFSKWLCLRLYQLSYTLEESYPSAEMYLVHSEVKWTRLTGNSKKKKNLGEVLKLPLPFLSWRFLVFWNGSVYVFTSWATRWRSLIPLQRCSRCILLPQSTGPLVGGVLNSEFSKALALLEAHFYIVNVISRTLVWRVLPPVQRCSRYILQAKPTWRAFC